MNTLSRQTQSSIWRCEEALSSESWDGCRDLALSLPGEPHGVCNLVQAEEIKPPWRSGPGYAVRRVMGWRIDAACAQADVEDVDKFFPAGRPSNAPLGLCHKCPVGNQCLEFALDSPWRPAAIVAGMTPRELEPLWRQRHPDTYSEVQAVLGLR